MSEFILQIEQLLTAFGDPEYRYLLIEPLIFYGLFVGITILLVGYFMKRPRLQMAALIVIGVAALCHVPYKEARLAAQPRIEQVYKISSPARVKGFKENTQEWVDASWKFRLLILATALTVMVGVHTNRIGFALGVITLFLGIVSSKTALWLHYQDAIAYHPNLKQHVAPIDQREKSVEPPPAAVREREIASPSTRSSAPPQGNRSSAPAEPPSASYPTSQRIDQPSPPGRRPVKPIR